MATTVSEIGQPSASWPTGSGIADKSITSNASDGGGGDSSSPGKEKPVANGKSTVGVNSGAGNKNDAEDDNSATDEDLWATWGELVHDWTNQQKKRPAYIKDMVRKGIPQHFRGICWQLLCNAQQGQLREKYAELLRQSSPCEKVINLMV